MASSPAPDDDRESPPPSGVGGAGTAGGAGGAGEPDDAIDSAGAAIPAAVPEVLTRRNWNSLWIILLVQAQNAFNDNVVRFVLIGLALVVAGDSALGQNVEQLSALLLILPFILLAPVAGFLSDRHSKRLVMQLCFVAQLVIFLWILLCLWQGFLWGVIAGFFILSIQSAFFSPAKQGILKELVGSRRLGMAVGWMQMTLMVSILAGIFLGGAWFEGARLRRDDAWAGAMEPVLAIGLLSLLPLLAILWVMPTPAHPQVQYRAGIWLSHFRDLAAVMRRRRLRLTALGIGYYWFLANLVGLMVIGAGRELALAAGEGSGVDQSAYMYGTIGVGLMIGSGLVAFCSRNRIELGLVPFGSAGFVIGLTWAGLVPLGSSLFYASMAFIGFSGAFFLVPLNAFLQDQAGESERGRVLAATNLMTNLAGVVAVGILTGMKAFGWSVSSQFLILVIPTALASLYVFRLLPQNALRFAIVALIRAVYRIRRVDHRHVPEQGGLLVISNHIGFSDAFLLGASFDRPLRFVMIEKYYQLWWARWFLDLFGAVPITPTKAKDAIRKTAAAASGGDMIGIFPEGQLTRTGLMHELKPGFQLIARQAGVPVLPVYMDGVWGSIFTFERNRYFTKWPRQLPYPVTVAFGEPVPAREATRDWAVTTFRRLSAEAFARRPELGHDLRRQWSRALSLSRALNIGAGRGSASIVTGDGARLTARQILRRLRAAARHAGHGHGHEEAGAASLPADDPDPDALLARLGAGLRDPQGLMPGLPATDARVVAAHVCHLQSVNLLLPGDAIRPCGDWDRPALWLTGVLWPLLDGRTLLLGGAASDRCRRVIEVRAGNDGLIELKGVPAPGTTTDPDLGAKWPPDRVLVGLAHPDTGALVAINLPEPPLPPDAEHQPSWRPGSVGKLLPGIEVASTRPLALAGEPLGGARWQLPDGAWLDDEGFVFLTPSAGPDGGKDEQG